MPYADALLAAASGLVLGLSLIVAIGAQNAFVLRQGLRGEHVLAVVAVCVASDAAFIAAGVVGAGAVLGRLPWLLPAARAGGALFLLGYGVIAAHRALRPRAAAVVSGAGATSRTAAVATAVALTWLNPHVYLDTAVLLGTVATSHGALRWWFAAGAGAASLAWFAVLGFGARFLRPLFARPSAWRVLDGLIAVVMVTVAAVLAGKGA